MSRSLVRICAAVAALAAPVSASADVFATRAGASPTEARIDALLVDTPEPGYTLIEQITMFNVEPQLVWLRPFPRAPETTAGPDVFDLLAEASVPTRALSDDVRAHPFGPSVLGIVTRRLGTTTQEPKADPPPKGRPLSVDDLAVFDGRATTSTLTGEVSLPPDMQAFLRRRDARLTNQQRGYVAHYLNLGWSILAAAMYDSAPSEELPARIGPLRFDFPTGRPAYPLLRRGPSSGTRLMFYGLGDGPRVPAEVRSRPANPEDDSGPLGEGVIRFAGRLDDRPEILFELTEGRGLSATGDQTLTQITYRPGSAQLDQLSFVAPDRAQVTPSLPPVSRRGSPADVFFCLLLGLTPLVLTPESWLIRFAQGKAREHAAAGGSRFGVKMWSVWALGVAAFWFLTLDDLARIAALGPLLVGTVQLAIPFSERRTGPVRAVIKKKKRSAKTSDGDQGSGRPRTAAS